MAWKEQETEKEVSLEYLTEEKFYPLSIADGHFTMHNEEYLVTICSQTIILANGEFATAVL